MSKLIVTRPFQHGPIPPSDSYSAAVIADGPLAYWRMNDGGSTMVDNMGNWNGGYYNAPSHPPGPFGTENAVSFNGTNQYCQVPAGGGTGPVYLGDKFTNWSLEFWVYGKTGSAAIMGTARTSTDVGDANISINAAGHLFFVLDFGVIPYSKITFSGAYLDSGQWNHVVVTHSSSTQIKFYVNGKFISSGWNDGGIRYNGNFTEFEIGRHHNYTYGDAYGAGTVDEVSLYTYVLSAAQVATHYEASGNTIAADSPLLVYSDYVKRDKPAFYYRFNETSGTTASSNGGDYSLTHHNSPTLGTASLIPNETSNNSITYNGTNQYSSQGSALFGGFSRGTIEVTITCPAYVGAGTVQTIVSYGVVANPQVGSRTLRLATYESSANDIRCRLTMVHYGGTSDVQSTLSLTPGQTYHIVMISDGTFYRMYINGQAQTLIVLSGSNDGAWFGAVNDGGTGTGTHNLDIAVWNNLGTLSQYFTGTIDELAFYGDSLSALQVQDHYNATGII